MTDQDLAQRIESLSSRIGDDLRDLLSNVQDRGDEARSGDSALLRAISHLTDWSRLNTAAIKELTDLTAELSRQAAHR
ncbi:hypothetical protein FDO65_10015 [Nakamurella flava]|uniref:Uncharacterized protein n=1 Tax=Nakamurella flava TaxID=2576308 RepID=A0A4U6QP62_9ACTN|nr:hypothetical protein [Nakamurella flava]TKV61852.1 hypothetical protein FDO65_10015 [Nakamurella flava]